MALMKSLASAIAASKFWIIGILAAGGIYFGVTYVTDKLESLTKQNTSLQTQVDESNSVIKQLSTGYAALEHKYSTYFKITAENQTELNKRLDQLDAARGKEGVVAKKPKLATKVAEKQVEQFQEKLACVSGNSQACSRLQSLLEGAHNPTTKGSNSQ